MWQTIAEEGCSRSGETGRVKRSNLICIDISTPYGLAMTLSFQGHLAQHDSDPLRVLITLHGNLDDHREWHRKHHSYGPQDPSPEDE